MRTRFDPKTMGYDDLKAIVAQKGTLSPANLRTWGVGASEDEIAKLATDLLTEVDPATLQTYLRVFAERPFPLGYAPLLRFVDSPDRRVMRAAIAALSVFRHAEVRALALRFLTTQHSWAAMDLLLANYEEGDHLPIEAVLRRSEERGEDEEHRFEMGVRRLFKQYPSPIAAPALLLVYERGRCFLCRRGTVKLLHQIGALPESIRQECEYDADFDTRAAARRHFRDDDNASEP